MKALAMALAILALAAAAAADDLDLRNLKLQPNLNYMQPYVGPPPPEPVGHDEKVQHCWGYLGRPRPISDARAFFMNGTLPSLNTCEGVVKVHRDCWPDMFLIWDFARPEQRIFKLRHHCEGRVTPRRGRLH